MATWFITGTSSGFGRILTEQLLERGDRVAATLSRPEAIDDLRAAAGDRLWVAQLDVTRPADVQRVVDEAFARLGSIDVVRAALPHLRAQGGGRILQVSSSGGQTTYPGFSYYHAAKWGVEGFCKTLAAEVAPFGIGVTIVEPGATPTGFGAAVDSAPVMAEYDAGPVGDVRRAIADGSFRITNDPVAIARAMIESADGAEAPLRLPLGDDTYRDVRASYVRRLELLDASRDLAHVVAGV